MLLLQYSDNVCGKRMMARCEVEESSHLLKTSVSEGSHVVTYKVTDRAGLMGECSFKVEVKVEGKSQCDSHAGIVTKSDMMISKKYKSNKLYRATI